ncbi:MAG: hypothetical protein FWE07_01060, partial [Turicibacter sp.]|nr:hypothetical protein [Turicibacter sp.]
MKHVKRMLSFSAVVALVVHLLPMSFAFALPIEGDVLALPFEEAETFVPELEMWEEFWTGEYEINDDDSVTLFFATPESQLVPQIVQDDPAAFNFRRVQTGIRTETSTELMTRGSLLEDDFHDPFGAPAGVAYTRTIYSYAFAGNDPLPASLIGAEYQAIYEAGGYITRTVDGREIRFSLVNAGNHSYLDNLVDPSNNGTASWNSAPGDGVYTLSGWVGRTGAGGNGGAHFRLAAGQYVNLQLLQGVPVGEEIVVFTTIARYNQWVFNPAHRITQETEDGLVWMRLIRVPSAPGAGQQNNPRFNWQKFVVAAEPVFNAVTYSWSLVEIVEEFPVYTYFWEKTVPLDEPVTEPPVTEPPVTEPPVTEPPVTEPPITEPPVTEPPVTEPPVTDPPVTEPPITEPPITEPPVTEPPITEPPVTEPPVT